MNQLRPATTPAQPFTEVTLPVQQGYARYQQQAKNWLQRYEGKGGKVFCKAGCFACCNMPIRVSLAEAILTAQALNADEKAAVERHARAVIENARSTRDDELYVQQHRENVGYCPLLDRATGACTQYEVRPTRCRDTYSAFPSFYCESGAWNKMSRHEQAQYQRDVARTPATDGELHFIAPLEHMSEPIWAAASKTMRRHWELEVWGDFWVLTTLASQPDFMREISAGNRRAAWQTALKHRLAHPMILEIEQGK